MDPLKPILVFIDFLKGEDLLVQTLHTVKDIYGPSSVPQIDVFQKNILRPDTSDRFSDLLPCDPSQDKA